MDKETYNIYNFVALNFLFEQLPPTVNSKINCFLLLYPDFSIPLPNITQRQWTKRFILSFFLFANFARIIINFRVSFFGLNHESVSKYYESFEDYKSRAIHHGFTHTICFETSRYILSPSSLF
ncbi:hypothetical protein HanRHA438_Chr08g0370241 [Helianthus annuus]|nr:hypothetical protein HanIR_Chr08g0386641 [Helianthus annuus]KAJ0899585.1 hypothetical protein HanRHA438_Chr08g0370241 [Helianthus annuus]